MNLQVIIWNPPNDTLEKYTLDLKLKALFTAVQKRKFFRVGAVPCIFVAPDYLFYDKKPYTEADFEKYEAAVKELGSFLEDDFLVIAGSMQWTDTVQKTLSVTSFITSSSLEAKTIRYDKKRPAATEKLNGYTFTAGKYSNTFIWETLHLGIEICQDHEEGTLYSQHNALKNGGLDVHVLLSFGQCRRDNRTAIKATGGLFIQCELETQGYWKKEKSMGYIPQSGVTTIKYTPGPMKQQLFATATAQVPSKSTQDGMDVFSCYTVEVQGSKPNAVRPKPEVVKPIIIVDEKQAEPLPVRKSVWQPDDSTDNCMRCDTEFGFISPRRHHCRQCGQVVCDGCSKGRRVVNQPVTKPGEQQVARSAQPVRVCDGCAVA